MSEHKKRKLIQNKKTIRNLYISIFINFLFTFVEIAAGIYTGSVALIGDALHNTSDTFSMFIGLVSLKIGNKKNNDKYTFGLKRAEIIGSFTNLILLFFSGCYLLFEGVASIIKPEIVNGNIIIHISIIALITDILTAKLSYDHSHNNINMKIVFLHNLADTFGSVGAVISGICISFFQLYYIDGVIATMIAFYMIFQSVIMFKPIINILMNSVPKNLNINEIQNEILKIKEISNIENIHLWTADEENIFFDCKITIKDLLLSKKIISLIQILLKKKFNINNSVVQVENIEDN